MGGRKLRYANKKNFERRRSEGRKSTEEESLVVSIQLCLLPPVACVVSIPLQVYTSAETRELAVLHSRLNKLQLLPSGWTVSHPSAAHLVIYKCQCFPPLSVPQVTFSIQVSHECSWDLRVCGCVLDPKNCSLLRDFSCRLSNVRSILDIVSTLNSSKICVGNGDEKFESLAEVRKGVFKNHAGAVVARAESSSVQGFTVRHINCEVVLAMERENRCGCCTEYRRILLALVRRAKDVPETRPQRSSPSSHVNYRYLATPEKIDRLRELHHRHRLAQKKLSHLEIKLQEAIDQQAVTVDEETDSDIRAIMEEEEGQVLNNYAEGSFQRIFWDQQKAATSKKDPRGIRWHPLMIKFCLYLRHQSSKAYETLRDSGCIKLPSQRTLRDYSHAVKAEPGFSQEADHQLMVAAKVMTSKDWEKLVVILLDEMYIREDLIYEKHSGTLIGFADLGEVNNHLLAFEHSLVQDTSTSPPLAKSVMVFMVRGLFSSLRHPYAHFLCSTVSGDLLFDPFWEAVYRLERMGLKVLAATFDGASVNRRLVKIHDTSSALIHKVPNIHAADGRDLFFFSDPPHLMKTVRNCWFSKARRLWCNGCFISWDHLKNLYEQDSGRGSGLALVPKLKFEHVFNLTSFAKMRVDLAAQVLSESVGKALEMVGGAETRETAKFVLKFDRFFDCLNVGDFTSSQHQRKVFKAPYYSGSDFRLTWLEDEFLGYLRDWEASVMGRKGFEKKEKNKMLLSPETRTGLRMTVHSFVGLVRYVFSIPAIEQNKIAFLSRQLCQDPLESYFGCQRQRGGTSDNPNALEFSRNTQALRVVNSFCCGPVRGNCRGGGSSTVKEDTTPLFRRRHVRSKTN